MQNLFKFVQGSSFLFIFFLPFLQIFMLQNLLLYVL